MVARTIARRLRLFGDVHVAGSLAEAKALLARRRPTGQTLDVRLGKGDGLAWLERLARAGQDPPTLVVTGWDDRSYETRAACAGHRLLHKPFESAALDQFARYAIAAEELPFGLARDLVASTASTIGFTAQQTRLVALAVARVDRKDRPGYLGITMNRYKKIVGAIVSGAQVNDLDDLVDPILRRVIGGTSEGE